MTHPRRVAAVVMAPLAVVVLFACVQTALAAVQLNFFNVIAFPSSVTLEWSTASEVNLAGFDIQCKQANEPDTAYHEIGFQPAKGGPNVGALYDFPVTSGLVPGNSYCFRLKEITTDGSPGDVLDRCGYGPMVTPTPGFGAIPVFTPVPVQTDAFGNPIVPTPTPQIPVVATDAFGNPITQIPGAVPTDAFGNPIPPTPFNPTSPLATPFPQAVATDAFGNPIPGAPPAVATDAFGLRCGIVGHVFTSRVGNGLVLLVHGQRRSRVLSQEAILSELRGQKKSRAGASASSLNMARTRQGHEERSLPDSLFDAQASTVSCSAWTIPSPCRASLGLQMACQNGCLGEETWE